MANKTFKNTLLQITREGMGAGDDALGQQLIANYFRLLADEAEPPRFVVFYNSGVRLICAGSPIVDAAKTLESKGTKLIACTTCLKHYGLMEQLAVGVAGTMMDIIELQKLADKVVTV